MARTSFKKIAGMFGLEQNCLAITTFRTNVIKIRKKIVEKHHGKEINKRL